MALKEYKQKRKFSATPEPQGGKPAAKALQFVVQKHDASRLHYDFRLEMAGVLKSWAVPKGPSLNPADKRLAMMVEDHPFDYKDFEGIIPEGNYGAGTVMVWDEGTYEPLHETTGSKDAQEKELLKELKAGSLKFRMNGKKLKGEFALVHTHGRGENSWLLIKHRDKYASEEPVTEKDKSVVSKKTLDQIAKNPRAKEWISNKSSARSSASRTSASSAARPTPSKRTKSPNSAKAPKASTPAKRAKPPSSSKAANTRNTSKRTKPPTPENAPKSPAPQEGRRSAMPADVAPMLATLVDKPFDEEGWSYEIKWDGYRALAYLKKGKVELRSRNNKSFEKFYPLYDTLKTWTVDAVLDGEVVVLNENGQSNFNGLQNWRSEADGELLYYVFDLLWLEGKDLTALPLHERREWLKGIVPGEGMVRYSESFNTSGTEFFAAAQKMGLEGIMAKKSDSQYTPGVRTKEWLKIKTAMRQEVVIGGFTRNEGTSKKFSSLLVGVFEKGNLVYTGKIGTGFTEKMQTEMMQQFKPLIQKTSPFEHVPDVNKPSRFRPDPPDAKAIWLKPKLVCEVSFREMTEDGVMRHPSFEGMREDKPAKQVVREKAVETEKVVDENARVPAATPKQPARPKSAASPKHAATAKSPRAKTSPAANAAKLISNVKATPKSKSTTNTKSTGNTKPTPMPKSSSNSKSTPKPISNAKSTPSAKSIANEKSTAKSTTNSKSTAASKPKAAPTTKPKSRKPAANAILKPVSKGERKTLLNPTDESQTRNINGHDLSFTNLSKIYWPKEKYTKRDLLNYYYQVAPYILPYLNDRPQSLNRHPNGITGPSFYQKNVSGKVPDWMKTFPYHSEGDSEDKEFLVCTDEASLLYMASLGCIELNPWSSRVQQPDNPDWCIIDLDPDKKTPFDKVIEAAQVTKQVLDAAGIDSYPKTSGSTGIHIYFPLGAKYDYEHSKEFARVIVTRINSEIPEFTSIERTVKARKGKMYLDFLQNRPQATIATAYSVRPKPGATVSAPLQWDEVKKGLKMQDFTIKTMPARLKEVGDLFKPVLGKGIDMAKALKKLEAM